MEKVIQAAGLLLLTTSKPLKFLLLKHADRLDLPKGHAEKGENLVATALRETEEETGISHELIHVDPNFRYEIQYQVHSSKRGPFPKRVTYFLGRIERPVPVVVTEHEGYHWYDWPVSGSLQEQTIDPLLASLDRYFCDRRSSS
jgi:8-oxo-dGTP pyrophosphatase MutT (NUDIX family)